MSDTEPQEETISDKVSGALFDRVGGFFSNMWDKFFDRLELQATRIFGPTIVTMIEGVFEKETKSLYGRMSMLQKDIDLPPAAMEMFDDLAAEPAFVNSIIAGFYTMAYQAGYVINVLPAVMGRSRLQANKDYAPSPLDIGFLANLWYKNPEIRDYVTDKATENGFSVEDVHKIFDSTRSMLNSDEVRELYLRGEINETQQQSFLTANGFEAEEMANITKLYKVIPSIPDLVRMAVREASVLK